MHAKFVALFALFSLVAAGRDYDPYGPNRQNNPPTVQNIPPPPKGNNPPTINNNPPSRRPRPNPKPVPRPPTNPPQGNGGMTCSSANQQCCNQVQDASHPSVKQAIQDGGSSGLLSNIANVHALLGTVTGQVGLTCNPITALGVAGQNCNQQTVCCSNNNFNGVVALGCTPINVNL